MRRLCIAIALLAALSALADSEARAADPPPIDNIRTPFVGDPFFLLTDASFGSTEAAQVRLEVTAPQSLATTGGVDIVVYRVPDPLAFLQKQRNLHRIDVAAVPAPEGLANTLTHVWDNWAAKARLTWQKLFSVQARRAVTAQAPALKTPKDLTRPSTFEEPRAFQLLPGYTAVQRFRYPVPFARPIAPPKDLLLAGSSSEFTRPAEGNVFVPLGVLAPGLYLVEAMAGQHRAHTLLFVSDTLAVSKTSGAQMLVWAAHRGSGQAVPGTRVVWSDGVGVLQTGSTDGAGLLRLQRQAPETSYVWGQDSAGGVFISENFYYDSEIYNAKVYATTDRPLYRPGDMVRLKVTGREFKSARVSVPLEGGDIALQVNDPAGQPVATQTLKFSGGADGQFLLPDNAPAGGYELMLTLRGERYTAAFRVADYQKPHFEITWAPDKADLRTGEPVAGQLQLSYPDGKPVAGARVSLTARAQRLSLVEGELDDSGAFAVKLVQSELTTDAAGTARYTLPAAAEPSRYTLTALATDGAAYRVRASREVLVERAAASYRLVAERQFSQPGERMTFRWTPSQRHAVSDGHSAPASWEWLRLEDRSKDSGTLAPGTALALPFARPGSYTVTLRDAQQRIVAAASHYVSGDGQKAPAGSMAIVFDRARYQPGDTATALLTFPAPVTEALVTLERDQVDAAVLLTRGGAGISAQRLGPLQWRVQLKVTEAMAPNVTLSVAVVQGGEGLFQNQGLMVEQPRIAIAFQPDQEVYAPGDTVTVDITTTVAGQPVAADVAVGVVDEMIYVLQPEIAPTIDDFFYHPRRNNVRTSLSSSFIGYDLATRQLGAVPGRRQASQRAIKVLERPRRDDVDTAGWWPALRTDAQGRTRIRFTMPDSLTRWRFTGRAMDATGRVGQQTAWVRSSKDFYAKWASPTWQRVGDQAQATVALFNQTGSEKRVQWRVQSVWPAAAASAAPSTTASAAPPAAVDAQDTLRLKPGINFITLPLQATQAGAATLAVTLTFPPGADGRVVDRLAAPLQRWPVGWRSPREQVFDLAAGPARLALPADATRVRVTLSADAAAGAFSRWLDELVDQPYGCVEQTASRMLPLALALQSLSAAQQPLAPMLTQRLAGARLSLAQMAGPQAVFGWWGRGMADDPFLTAYAYYADWRATQALRVRLPDEHWQRLLDVYAKAGSQQPPLQRALALHWMQEMGLTVAPMQAALIDELLADTAPVMAPVTTPVTAPVTAPDKGADKGIEKSGEKAPAPAPAPRNSLVLGDAGASRTPRDMALVLAVHGHAGRSLAPARAAAEAAAARLAAEPSPLAQALLLLARPAPGPGPGAGPTADRARALLAQVRGELPTFDRAQALVWTHKALGGRPDARVEADALGPPWVAGRSSSSGLVWQAPAGGMLPADITPRPTSAPASPAAWAYVAYESSAADTGPALPVRIERRLYRVRAQPKAVPANPAPAGPASRPGAVATPAPPVPDDGRLNVKLELLAPGTPLDSNTLYLDEISLQGERALRWTLLEAALPPGAAVEASTWGLDVQGSGTDASRPLERATHQNTAQGYAVPVEALAAQGRLTVRHLVRFAQRGQFRLPPPRLYRMYEPEAKATDRSGQWLTMEVR